MTIPGSHRDKAEGALQAARKAESAAENEEFHGGTQVMLAEAHSHLLRAIYHELRHGHDQQADQAAAMKDMTEAIETLARRLPDR
jgi:hypothetical protein